jgi:DNA sulfur modification protein DndE
MTWSTFGGKEIELYKALLRSRLIVKNHSVNDQSVHKTLRKHLYRGIMAMADRGKISGIASLISIINNTCR